MGHLPSGFRTKTLCTPLLSPIRATCPAHFILYFITRTIVGEEYRSLCSFLHSPGTSSLLGQKYSPQHPLLKQPQPTFLPLCERPSFTPIQNIRQNYILYILIFKFLDSQLEDKGSVSNPIGDFRFLVHRKNYNLLLLPCPLCSN